MVRARTARLLGMAAFIALCVAWGGVARAAGPAAGGTGPVLCVAAGQTLELDVRFHDAPPAGLRLLREPGGEVVASFHGRFGQGAGAEWQAGAGPWRGAAGAGCYRLVCIPDAPGGPPVCLVGKGRIGFAVGPDAPLFATVRYRGADLQPADTGCEAFPAARDDGEPVASPRPPAAAAPDDDGGFPWPPPRPSTRRVLSRPLAIGDVAIPTLGSVADRLQAALESAGYVEYGYYPIPGGFALATRLERIHPDGRAYAEPARWEWGQAALTGFDLGAYVRALFDVEQGRFRVIVFVVTDAPLDTTPDAPRAAQALAWPGRGAPTLPSALRKQAYSDEAYTAALVYEFESRGRGHEAAFKAQSRLTGDAHLRQARLLAALE